MEGSMHRLLICIMLLPLLALHPFQTQAADTSALGQFVPKPYRDEAATQAILDDLTRIMDDSSTKASPDDMLMGRIHDLAAGLRYPLAMGDALAATLDTLVNPRSDKARRDAALQTARVALYETVEGVRAWLRIIRDQRSLVAGQSGSETAVQLLNRLETSCTEAGVLLENLSKRCLQPTFTAPVQRNPMLFLDEAQAQRMQTQKSALLDSLSIDRNQQNFLGGLIYQKIEALRFPLMDSVRVSFFIERLFEGTDNATMRATALIVAQTVVDRHALTLRQAIQHISAIEATRQGREYDLSLLARAQAIHGDALLMLDDIRARYNKAQP